MGDDATIKEIMFEVDRDKVSFFFFQTFDNNIINLFALSASNIIIIIIS